MKIIRDTIQELSERIEQLEERILLGTLDLEEYRRLSGERAGMVYSLEQLRERYETYVKEEDESS